MESFITPPPLPAPNTAGLQQARLWAWQRISAMVLAVCVLVHIAVMVYAVRGGLSGAEILSRTRGNLAFGLFYTVFLLACVVHVPIGLANIAREWLGMRPASAVLLARMFALLLLVLGGSALFGVLA